MPTSLRARVVFPVDRPPIDGGVVTIEGERIVAVGPADHASGPVRDLGDEFGDVALLPGFVNAHTHLEFSHLRAPLGRLGMPLVEWLPLAIGERQNRGHSAEESIALGLQESLQVGTCAIGEIATAPPEAYGAASEIALHSFLEVIGFSRALAESAFAAIDERLAEATGTPNLGLSPHAPYTVSPALLGKLVELARARELPMAMHLAESAEELELLAEGAGPFRDLLDARSMWDAAAIPAGSSPFDYLQVLARAPRCLVVHGTYLVREDHEFLAAQAERMTVVYCPRTHAYFQHPRYPLAEVVAAGGRVALGTDSRASNPDLSVLAEFRQAARTHSEVPAEKILAMATLHGAAALGCERECGSITPGKLANLVAVPMSKVSGAGDALEAIVASEGSPTAVWLRGREI
jgi:cytosine/adenosine deaminase-related metal-dependent hydrolase